MSWQKIARARAARRVVALYLKTASPEIVQRTFPALSAAFDTYNAVREQEQQAERARQFVTYPGTMTEHSMFSAGPLQGVGSSSSAPPVQHHRRHRHHH